MPFDGPAAGIGASLLSRLDLSRDEVVRDFTHELRRCATNEDYAAWAVKWGENACTHLSEAAGYNGDDYVTRQEFHDLERECEEAETSLADLKDAVQAAEKAIDQLDAEFDLGEKLQAALDAIFNRLEAARTEA